MSSRNQRLVRGLGIVSLVLGALHIVYSLLQISGVIAEENASHWRGPVLLLSAFSLLSVGKKGARKGTGIVRRSQK